VNYF